MIKISDFIIELGPKGGKDGGNVFQDGLMSLLAIMTH